MAAICPKCRSRFDDRLPRCPHDGRPLVADLSGLVVAGRYTLRELLGVGGMDSSVWLALQQPVQRHVAIKLLPPTDGDSADRFARGARIASNLAHPHITVVHDYGRTEDGKLFLVMELLEGRVLHDVLRGGGMPVERALHITDQVLKALDHAHRRNVVHRDIKPGNLFLSTRNDDPDFVKVLDFGIARFIDADDAFFDEPLEEITTTRQICGTPQYMAPEQIAMGTVDARTDLYALGVVLYRMLTGELPFNSRDHRELFRAHLTQTPPPFSAIRPGFEFPELEALVMRVLAKSPDDRFASAAEMRLAIRQLRGRLGIAGVEDEFTPMSGASMAPSGLLSNPGTAPIEVARPRRDLWVPLLVLVVMLLGLGAFLWLRTPSAPPAATPDARVAARAPVTDAAPETAAVPPPEAPDAAPPTEAAAPATEPPPATGQVQITSNPPGATIRLGDEVLGTTPTLVTLPVGAHRLTLVRGGATTTLAVVASAEAQGTAHALLAPARPERPVERPERPVERPAAPRTSAPATAAPETAPPRDTLRMKLLDEREAREFDVRQKPASPTTEKAQVPILDD